METDQLQKLMQKCLSGDGSEQEWTELKSALEEEENLSLRHELFQLGKLEMTDLKVDEDKMWQAISVHRAKGNHRIRLSRRILRYAAIIAIPLLLGSIFVGIRHLKQDINTVVVAAIEPGQSKAILKLNNGKQVDLAMMGRDTVFMRDGVTVRLDSTQTISYQAGEFVEGRNGYDTIIVPRGGEYRLVLADGSLIWLNSDSELRFPVAFSGKERKVFLKGEAYFDVAKNPSLPFIVETEGMEVKVLGTRFNVNAYRVDGEVQTTLVSGKVEVRNVGQEHSVTLHPDQQAILKNGTILVKEVDAEVYTAWRDGKFYFESETLEEIAAQLERWYNISFFFAREGLKYEEFTGVIRRDYTANQILEIIAKTTSVQFDIKGRTVTVH